MSETLYCKLKVGKELFYDKLWQLDTLGWGCVQQKPAWYLYNYLRWQRGRVINSCLEGVVLLSKSSDNVAEPFYCRALLFQLLIY